MKEKFIFFWKAESPFSQWFPAVFVVENIRFNCAEQYMMCRKAILFGDDEMAEKILTAPSPQTQKALGKQVRHFVESVWEENCREIVYTGNHAKFSQNAELKRELLATEGTTLVEASPHDRIWGVGLAADDPRIRDRKKWRGENRREILTRLRDEFKKDQ